MKKIDSLRVLLPPDDKSSDIKLGMLLDNAENTLLDYIGRDSLPERLADMQIRLALEMYNRLGNEGETKRTENDISVSFSELRLRNYPRKVGAVKCS